MAKEMYRGGRPPSVRHAINPYATSIDERSAVIFTPSEYQLNLILSTMSAQALRVLLYAMHHVDNSGMVHMHTSEMAKVMQRSTEYVRTGWRELVKHNIMSRKTTYEFWLNPEVAMPVNIGMRRRD